MIRFHFRRPERGTLMEYGDVASALVAAQDEADRWTRALNQAGGRTDGPATELADGYVAPLRAWEQVIKELNEFRRNPTILNEYDAQHDALTLVSSPTGMALMWTLKMLGQTGAHAAAVSAGLVGGPIDWTNDAEFRGVVAFERFLRRRLDHDNEEAGRGPGQKLDDLILRADDLKSTMEKYSALTETLAKRAKAEDEAHRGETAAAFKSLKEEANKQRSKFDRETASLHLSLKEFRESKEEELSSWASRNDNLLKSQAENNAENLQNALKEGKATLENWIKANIEQRQIAEPARLWATRAEGHARRASALRWWTIVIGLAGLITTALVGYGSFSFAVILFADAVFPGGTPAISGTLRPIFHYQLIFTGLVTLAAFTMYLWAMRVLVRLYTTEHHLEIDASSRGVMNNTYIGLIAAGAANEQDRAIVLSALFRPVQDGIVKDDGPPSISPAAVLSGFVGNSK